MIVADDLTIEIAPGADLDADPSTWTWVDITTRVRTRDGVDITGMGRGGESADADTPSLTIRVENEGGDFSSRNPLGEWFPDLGVGTPIRVYWDTDANIRFAGHISELPPRWIGDEAGSDEVAVLRADGFTRRLTQGEQALNSPLFRSISTHDDVVAYWPCEDETGSEQAYSPLDGVNPFMPSGVVFGESREQSGGTLFGALQVMRIDEGARNVLGRVPNHTPDEAYGVQEAWMIPEQPTAARAIMDVYTTSTDLVRWQLRASATQFQVRAWDADDTVVIDQTETLHTDFAGQWLRPVLILDQDGTAVDWYATIYTADAEATILNELSGTESSSDVGRVVLAGVNGPQMGQERYAGHITVLTAQFEVLAGFLHEPFHGWTGERAAARFERLCAEEGIPNSVDPSDTEGMFCPPGVENLATTDDHSSLDITGDIDLRAIVLPTFWTTQTLSQFMVAKFHIDTDDRSYGFFIDTSGKLGFSWSTDGTAGTRSDLLSTARPQISTEPVAMRMTMDVDNGASGHTLTFYTAAPDDLDSSLDGTWTQLGDAVVTAGTTSIYSGAAPLEAGGLNSFFAGFIYRAQVRNSIGGTIVASPDFTAEAVGTTSFADSTGKTWTLVNDAKIARTDDSMPMGPQQIATLTELLQQIETADAGVLSEADFGFVYRTLTALYNQAAALTLSQPDGELAFPPEPTDDDRHARNDITANSPFGTSVRAIDEDHIGDHGRYAESVDINPETTDQLQQAAYWRLHLGTVDEYRWPRIDIALHADPDLIDDWLAVRVGDRLTVDHDIAQLAGVDIDLIVAGWDERFDQFNWDVALNCVPASPHSVFVLEDDPLGRIDTAGSETSGSFDAGTDTSLTVVTTATRPWVNTSDHASEFPFEIQVAGVVLNVTAISGSTSPQTFTVDATPTNGVEKTIPTASAVHIHPAPVLAL